MQKNDPIENRLSAGGGEQKDVYPVNEEFCICLKQTEITMFWSHADRKIDC
ncbi:hypothetical protein [Bacillus inaquosorum]|uniref:hypothetical protein n=1 Tax=Bacillus inaquosorum TaxID=483913 RepID=UPI000A94A1E1|nr:hypothetical protein [Bacillus inaquosorum]MBT2192533.1 hypothetical protein [Bacillus inaquosorum]MBT3119180.1 hypothetical protein [Bacillus inaquosorum]MBT3122932.1 hypothetical protein [Bacillus inaquosorum]MDZ5543673.1 hypothetical protein [Bacillus inaquosorum]MEC0872183.1 hypothetical protein [Bacillus inaquosorum]